MSNQPGCIENGAFTLDCETRKAFLHGVDLQLTGNEFSLLELLLRHAGRKLDEEYVCERGLNAEMTDGGLAVAGHITTLQEKLAGSGCTIVKSKMECDGFGFVQYRFEQEG